MKLLSKISLVAIITIAPLALQAKKMTQSANSGIASLAADLNSLEQNLSNARKQGRGYIKENERLYQQMIERRKERLATFVNDIEQGKLPKSAVNKRFASNVGVYGRGEITPLFEATQLFDLDLVKRLLHLGAQADIVVKYEEHTKGLTPLIYAIGYHATNIIKELIKATKKINLVTPDGTALGNAALMGNAEIVKLLLAAGANASLKDNEGKTALDYALMNQENENWQETIQLLEAAQGKNK